MTRPSDYEKAPLVATAAQIGALIQNTPDGWAARQTPLVPDASQLLVESDTGTMKVGDGSTAYADLPALPGGGGDPSLLSGFANNVDAGDESGVFIPWTLDVAEGSDITVDEVDPTKIHVTAGGYLFQVSAFLNNDSTATSGTLSYTFAGGTWLGGDGPGTGFSGATPPAPWVVWWLYASTDAVIKFKAAFVGVNPGDVVGAGLDVVRLGG